MRVTRVISNWDQCVRRRLLADTACLRSLYEDREANGCHAKGTVL